MSDATMTFGEVMTRARENLPEDWEIHVVYRRNEPRRLERAESSASGPAREPEETDLGSLTAATRREGSDMDFSVGTTYEYKFHPDSLRDYFAASALCSVACGVIAESDHGTTAESMAAVAYRIADAMLAIRNNPPSHP